MKHRHMAWQAALLLSAQSALAADMLPSNPETDSDLQSLGITVGNGLSLYAQRDGYYLIFEKEGSGWKLASIESRAKQIDKLSDKEILFVSRDVREVEPDYRDGETNPKNGQFTCRSGMANQNKSGRHNYNPCDSSLTSTIDYKVGAQALLTLTSFGLNILTGTGVRDVAVDKTKVLALLQETKALDQVREKKAADDRRTYLDAFTKAKSASALNAFIQRYSNNDPDGLIPQAIERRDQAKGDEYRRAFDNATTVASLDSFILHYQGKDPDSLIPKAIERRKVALVEEQRQAQIKAQETEQQRKRAVEFDNRMLSLLKTPGTKICNAYDATLENPTGAVLYGHVPLTEKIPGKVTVSAFTEGASGNRLQLRVSSIYHTSTKGRTTYLPSFNVGSNTFQPGAITWDAISNWAVCDVTLIR